MFNEFMLKIILNEAVANRYISTARIRRKSVGNESPKLNNYVDSFFEKIYIYTHILENPVEKNEIECIFRNATCCTGDDFLSRAIIT